MPSTAWLATAASNALPPACRMRAAARVFFGAALLDERSSHGAAIVQRRAMPDPLPDLRARDFCRGRILHQVVDRNGALTAEPGLQILNADADIVAQARVGPRAAR